ncbi:DUF4166 domain-containing protein [Hymenobacter weizhouensis]|uniref:DUF4166 domain-containing protein n=1 Tax=Hymenobacter sp. YIM 151500-1 TaxID=2987689 RepID=UPI0022266E07|nr:DUF4166 domain-containing protein [Hymenobacter sp. YIM 151500-1]UYZ64558.1 DUF4166 domain-containing protein [Hymenobacter sp. YIM 151500-1]
MQSIYERTLGADFARLHPRIQERLRLHSTKEQAFIGRGTMEQVWHGPFIAQPFLRVGLLRHIMFPETGRQVPFRIENYAYRDALGRETVTWIRRFEFPQRTRCFDATMIWSQQRSRIVDYLGTHQHLAVDIDLAVTERGGLRLLSGEQRFYEGPLSFRFPMLLSGRADVEEWYDDAAGCYRIQVEVSNRTFGKLFGYRGHFQPEWQPVASADIPAYALPVRTEARE